MSKLTKNERIDRLVACLRTQGIKMRELEVKLEVLEEWSNGADRMLTELNHALPDPEYDAKCEAAVAGVEASLDRHRERLGLNKPKLKQLDQSVFEGQDEKWRFAAVDADGKAHRCNLHVKPCYERGEFWRGCTFPPFEFELIGEGYDTTNWQNSLIERESKELTGSDLCRAMLARGDKYVMCLVSDDSQEDALLDGRSSTISSITDNGCFDGCDFTWLYATPINNQGEPLTAADVGL